VTPATGTISRSNRPAARAAIARLHVLAADCPLLRDEVGAPDLVDLDVAVARVPAGGAGVRVGETERGGQRPRRPDRHHAHVLHAARDDQVGRAAHDGLRGEVHGLLCRAALAVDGDAGDLLGHPGGEPGRAGDVAGLRADRADAAEDHVVHGGRVDAAALDQRGDGRGAEVRRVYPGESASAAADGCADHFDQICLGHHVLLDG
jgi:hypothetical protein